MQEPTVADNAPAAEEIVSAISVRSKRIRFAGPLRTRVIADIGMKYSQTVGWAIAIGIAHVLIGAIVMSTSIYSLHKGEFHGALFSIAYHFLAAEAILSLSFINGWSTPMRRNHRRCVHALLQICAIPCVVFGALTMSMSSITQSRTVHGLSGFLTLVLTGTSWVLGPLALKGIVPTGFIHMLFGITCFLMSTLCLCFGLIKDKFKRWAGQPVVNVLLGFVIFYTFFMFYTTCMKCAQRYKVLLAKYKIHYQSRT